jgi:hypothetical protein
LRAAVGGGIGGIGRFAGAFAYQQQSGNGHNYTKNNDNVSIQDNFLTA